MLGYFSKAFKITNENIILTTPLVLFLFLLSIYLGLVQRVPASFASLILLLVTIWFMISAFFAGWFFMVKKAVDLDKEEFTLEEDRAKSSFNLLKEIPVGVGEYFLSYIVALGLYALIFVLIIFAGYKAGLHFIGDVGLNPVQLKTLFSSPESMAAVIKSMSSAQLIKLRLWNLMFFTIAIGYSFLTMFWGVHIITRTKNALLAFVQSIGVIFKHFLQAVILFCYTSFINFLISLLNSLSSGNPLLYFFSMLIYFYFLVYVVVLVFLYYDREIKEKAQSHSDSWADSVG